MGKVSSTTAEEVKDFGAAVERSSTVDGQTFSFVSIRETMDLGPMLAGLPGGHCSCPHWGYLLKGRMTVRYADHVEVLEPGDAFYMPPGHVPEAEAGSEFVIISPADELAATDAAIEAAMQAH